MQRVELHSIARVTGTIRSLPRQPDWYLGVMLLSGRACIVIDPRGVLALEGVASRTQGYSLVSGDGAFAL